MRVYKIAFHGDNERLHEEALRAAIDAAEKVNRTPAYRAWIEEVEYVDVELHAGDRVRLTGDEELCEGLPLRGAEGIITHRLDDGRWAVRLNGVYPVARQFKGIVAESIEGVTVGIPSKSLSRPLGSVRG